MDPWSSALIEAMDKVRPAVVHVHALTPASQQLALGTGVLMDNYHIIASAQVVAMDDEVTVTTYDGRKRRATCIGIDPLYFLAILRLEERVEIPAATFAAEGTVPVGLHVFALGNAFGSELTASNGIVAAKERTVYRPPHTKGSSNIPVDGLLFTTAAMHPGNTGGPLCDLEGRVVGINGIPWQGGVSIAVQANVAGRVASQIIDYGYAIHPWLGFSGEPDVIESMWVSLLALPADRGVMIQHVARNGPGKRAGLQEMDMILAVDGLQPVNSVGYIRRVLASHRHGEKVPLTVLRQGEVVEVLIPVEEIPKLSDPPDLDDEDAEMPN